MADFSKIKVGDTIWIQPKRYPRGVAEPIQCTVSKVGRKYFEVEDFRFQRFQMSDGKQCTEMNYPSQAYHTLQEILDEKEIQVLTDKIRVHFTGFYGSKKFTLEQLRAIDNIIDPKQ